MNLESLTGKYQSSLARVRNVVLNYADNATDIQDGISFYANHLWKNRKGIAKDARKELAETLDETGTSIVNSLDNLAEKANYAWQERGRLANEAEDKLGNAMYNTGRFIGRTTAQAADYLWKNKANLPEAIAADAGIAGITAVNNGFYAANKFWKWKGKKHLVDATGIMPPLFILSTINEQFLHPNEVSWAASGKARLIQATYVPFIAGSVMEVRDWTRRNIFNIHDEENVSFIRDASANTFFTFAMNSLFYVPCLIGAGITDKKTLFWSFMTNVGLRSVLHTTVTFPWLKSWREVWGTTPKPKKAKEQPNPFLLPEEAFNYYK